MTNVRFRARRRRPDAASLPPDGRARLALVSRIYRKNPQLDRAKAVQALTNAERVLVEFPYTGATYEDFETVREYKVLGTAFSLLYSVARETVWIIDVRDQRGQRSAEALRRYLTQLKASDR